MAKSVLVVRGIGQSTAAILAENGIQSAEDLAGAKIEQLLCIQGFSETRAARVISDAQALLASSTTGENEKPVLKSKPVKSTKKKSTKKESKKEKKQKEAKKKSSDKDKSKKKNKKKKKSKKSSQKN